MQHVLGNSTHPLIKGIDWALVARESFQNTHALGLNSIRINDTQRIFYTSEHHELDVDVLSSASVGNNAGGRRLRLSKPLPLGIHGHRHDFTFTTLHPGWSNHLFDYEPSPEGHVHYFAYVPKRGLTRGDRVGVKFAQGPHTIRASEGSTYTIPAQAPHTVSVERGVRSAWLITEGQEDPLYTPHVVNHADTRLLRAGRYTKSNLSHVVETLKWCRVIEGDFNLLTFLTEDKVSTEALADLKTLIDTEIWNAHYIGKSFQLDSLVNAIDSGSYIQHGEDL